MRSIKFSNVFLVNPQGEVLVLRRTAGHPTRPLALDLPGGGLEEGEDFMQAAIREVHEETGLTIRPGSLELIRHNELISSGRHLDGVIYRAGVSPMDVSITLSSEHDRYYWIKPTDIKSLPEFHQASLVYALEYAFLH